MDIMKFEKRVGVMAAEIDGVLVAVEGRKVKTMKRSAVGESNIVKEEWIAITDDNGDPIRVDINNVEPVCPAACNYKATKK
ncbi:MAG: hypothetical protein GY854_19845 [Deltaproteobacteria bacterium]|nr:hypothetical protein [Deltaproteobacteria bacterium]